MNDTFLLVADYLQRNLLSHAFRLMHDFISSPNAEPQWADQLQELQQNYHYLTSYYLSGENDPQRTAIIQQLVQDSYQLLDNIVWANHRSQLPGVRFHMEEVARMAIQSQLEATQTNPIVEEFATLKMLFYTFWLTPKMHELKDLWHTLIKSNDPEQLYVAVAGMIVGCLDQFSDKKLITLLEDILILPPKAQNRVIVGLFFLLNKYAPRLEAYPALLHQLQILTSDTTLHEKVMLTHHFMLETSLMGEVLQAMQEMQKDILPTIQKQEKEAPIILNIDEMEEGNPNWAPDLQDSLHKHIDHMTHLHREGADFTYSASKALLHEPFFQNDIANFFLSFDIRNPQLGIDYDSQAGDVIRKLLNVNIEACDLDKYATCMMYRHLSKQLITLPDVVNEMGASDATDMLSTEDKDFLQLKLEVKNWSRFFLHNPWGYENQLKEADCFVRSILPELLHMTDEERLTLADKCLRLQLYEAVPILLFDIKNPTVEAHQKAGYAAKKSDDIFHALHEFERAIALQEDDYWSMYQAAQILVEIHDFPNALRYYDMLLEHNPKKKSYLLGKAYCYMEQEDYENAMQLYFQLDLLYPDQRTIQRGLGWCALISKRFETAERYLRELAEAEDSNATDCLNYAHYLLLQGKRQEAFHIYHKGLQLSNDSTTFFDDFENDREILISIGISNEELSLMADLLIDNG